MKYIKFLLTNFLILLYIGLPLFSKGQDCSMLSANFISYESRCAATGSIKIEASGGSGSYKYKTFGPVNSNFTTSDSITGLSAGTYSVVVTDIISNCSLTTSGVIVPGTYQDPRFALSPTNVSCDNGFNGSIMVNGQEFGRGPFLYSIVSPSPMAVGVNNTDGVFKNLKAGEYTIRMTDSCGGIQTRQTKINNYTWQIDSYNFIKTVCDSASGYIKAIDSKGNISTIGSGIPGFTYGIVRQVGDTIWFASSTFQFDLKGNTNFDVLVKDSCGEIKKGAASIVIQPTIGGIVVSSKLCNSFTATVSGTANFFSPNYCLFDSSNVLVSCNSSGVFPLLPYGNYCVTVQDACSNKLIRSCFGAVPPAISFNQTVAISKKVCASFSASITGQIGFTNPSYCLYDSTNTVLYCNGTGVFDLLPYGPYCITVQDGCRDTTLKTCFNTIRQKATVPDIITPIYVGSCATTVGINIGGNNLTNPNYCLYDSNHILIGCNNTGIFNGLAFGKYCANVVDSCIDTTFIRCFLASPPESINDLVNIVSNKACLTFTVKSSSNTLTNANYCLFTASDSLIACNNSGIFNNVNYGSYCVKAQSICPDTTFINCFTATPSLPSVNSMVQIFNSDCAGFSAQITGQTNLTNPSYCLYDANNILINCNNSGQFTNIAYGNYCIKIINTCYDTTILRCFTSSFTPVKMNVSSYPSCSYNYARLNLNITSGLQPFIVSIYSPNGDIFLSKNYSINNIVIDSIPSLAAGQVYKLIVSDNCGSKDSANVSVITSFVNHNALASGRCPSGTFVNGSGDINASAVTNMGSLSVALIMKNNTNLSPILTPNTVISGVYTFQNLSPGIYILRYNANDGCNKYLYDTVAVNPYQYPSLGRSSAYQCDINGFSLGAVVSNGVGPFDYEIIGSSPNAPSIVARPQQNPIFSVNNGTNYSLVRLRAVDACGNGTLADASIMPLANTGIINTYNCFQIATTLSIDTVYGSTYAWYKKTDQTSTDSVFLGNSTNYYIPEILPSDTGIYVCNLIVNKGCISRTYYYHLDGSCYHALPILLQVFAGNIKDNKSFLNWKMERMSGIRKFIVERKNALNIFSSIGEIFTSSSAGINNFNFIDNNPENYNWYRLKIVYFDNRIGFSEVINLNKKQGKNTIQVYPNPSDNYFTINFAEMEVHSYKISLLSALSQVVKEIYFTNYSNILQVFRTNEMSKGLYILKVVDLKTRETITQKVIFR